MTSSHSNLAMTFSPRFSADETALILGTYLPQPAFVCERESGRIVACNQDLLRFLEIERADLDDSSWSWTAFLRSTPREELEQALLVDEVASERRLEALVLRADSEDLPVRLTVKPFRWRQLGYCAVFVENISRERRREAELLRQVEEQKGRASAAIQSSLRLYHLSEKIKWTPVITRDLLRADCEDELFRDAAKILTHAESLNYREVTFFLIDDHGYVDVAFSTRPLVEQRFRLVDRPEYRTFLETGECVDESSEGILLRLDSHGTLLGFCLVLPHEQEKAYFSNFGKVTELQKDFLTALGDIMALLIDNIRLSREIRRQSIIDPLTSVFNRRYFMERLREELERAQRYERDVSLIFLDLDGFKEVNDQHGHLQGDQVLRGIADILVENFREADIVCRYGGDEFVVLLPETTAEMALTAAEKLVEAVGRRSLVEDGADAREGAGAVTVSVGVSTLEAGQTDDEFLQAADIALFKAKRQGKNRVACYP